jgi:hypothetical protein
MFKIYFTKGVSNVYVTWKIREGSFKIKCPKFGGVGNSMGFKVILLI